MQQNQINTLRAQVEILKEQNAQLLAILERFAEWRPQPIAIQLYNNTTAEGGKVTAKQDATHTTAHPSTINVSK